MKYIADKKNSSSSKGIKFIQINVIDILLAECSKSWVFAIGSVDNICNTMQGLQNVCKLGKNEVVIQVRNGNGITAQAIGVMSLS